MEGILDRTPKFYIAQQEPLLSRVKFLIYDLTLGESYFILESVHCNADGKPIGEWERVGFHPESPGVVWIDPLGNWQSWFQWNVPYNTIPSYKLNQNFRFRIKAVQEENGVIIDETEWGYSTVVKLRARARGQKGK